jgi:ornithine carbamoyltransferase
MQGELDTKSIKDLVDENLVDLVEQLVSITHKITEEPFEITDNADIVRTLEWKSLRQFSSAIQRKLEIQLTVNTEIVKNCVEHWLHP